MIQGNIERFAHLSNFKSLKDFNNNIEMFLADQKSVFTKSEYIGFMKLTKYCAKVVGVSNAKIGTILKSINDTLNGNGISRSTFKRMIIKAKSLGILSIVETTRKNGSQSSNVFIFNRYEPPKREKLDSPYTTCPFNTNKSENKERKESLEDLNYTFTPSHVPEIFINAVRPFYNRAVDITHFYNKALMAYKMVNLDKPIDHYMADIVQSFKDTVFRYKQRKIKGDFIGYYFGVLKNTLKVERRRESYTSVYDWSKHTSRNAEDYDISVLMA
ncbi:hypothetical protein [Guptibacillus hwajinpoensis]|uniref:hypothetical protein n=1 Tax=Guptibacillus hwajinpoensis TaxID=208199 RepID=UPI003736CAB3